MAVETTKQIIERYIKEWLENLEELEAAKKRVTSIEIDLANSINALGKFVLPENIKDNELFFIQVFGRDAQGKEGVYWLGITRNTKLAKYGGDYGIVWHDKKPVKDIKL